MLLNTWSSRSSTTAISAQILLFPTRKCGNFNSEGHGACFFFRKMSKTASFSTFTCLGAGVDTITEIVHNKVLVAAVVSGAVGQLLKPSTSAIFYGKKFDFKAAFQAGGFPSTHSSAAVATAASLGLERGFSDAIFGLAVVYAGLTMYDAQGVRREVGTHAKVLNRILSNSRLNSIPSSEGDGLVDLPSGKQSSTLESLDPVFCEEQSSSMRKNPKTSLLSKSSKDSPQNNQILIPSSSSVASDARGGSKVLGSNTSPLKESVGHTEIEVIAGALLGLFVSLAICNFTV